MYDACASALKKPTEEARTHPEPTAFSQGSGQPNARLLIRHRIKSYRIAADALEALLRSIPETLTPGAEDGLLELCIRPPQ